MAKNKSSSSQLQRSLKRLETALKQWEELQDSCKDVQNHPSEFRSNARKLLKKLKVQIDDLKL